ncbi:sensor histidine kinase [Palleronia sp.]|uniref:sensor histidine kinase n=1 Tax=Palleronia sp. TaxID=1940284 RepID=UPI0035C81315
MDDLVRDLLDLARGRLGGGIPVRIDPGADMKTGFQQVISEIETASGREILAELDCGALPCDRQRMGQLLSNLLGNAVTHGTRGAPIHVRAAEEDGHFVVSVTNAGKPIPKRIMRSLFKPFTRSACRGRERPGPWALYRVRDCEGAWRHADRGV